jgi:hypothetical protein
MSKREDAANYVATMKPGLRQAYALAYLRHRLGHTAAPPARCYFRGLPLARMQAIEQAIDRHLDKAQIARPSSATQSFGERPQSIARSQNSVRADQS